MGNWWSGACEKTCKDAEIKLLGFGGMLPEDYTISNVPIWPQQRGLRGEVTDQNFIHEIRFHPTREGLPKLVLIHGLAGTGSMYYRLISHLRSHFEVFTIDWLGQGLSGRPDYEEKHDFAATVAYFTESIHAWVEQSPLGKDGEKFHMLGHSMGGLWIGHYALRYPDNIERLIFLSSVGIAKLPQSLEVSNIMPTLNGRFARYGAAWAERMTRNCSMTPFDPSRMLGPRLSKRAIKEVLDFRIDTKFLFKDSDPSEMETLTELVHQMFVKKRSSEVCLTRIFLPFVYTHEALADYLPQISHIPMAFLVGEFDWVGIQAGETLLQDGQVQGELFVTADSGHDLFIEAPEECVACILKFSFGAEAAHIFTESLV